MPLFTTLLQFLKTNPTPASAGTSWRPRPHLVLVRGQILELTLRGDRWSAVPQPIPG